MKRFLGIDPGLRKTGWAVLELMPSNDFSYISSGVINTVVAQHEELRLLNIFENISNIIKEYHPLHAGIEKTYVNIGYQSSLKLAQARAASMIACAMHQVGMTEYQAKTVKKSIVGNGEADKSQVLKMINLLIKDIDVVNFDEADAIAIAMCDGYHFRLIAKSV